MFATAWRSVVGTVGADSLDIGGVALLDAAVRMGGL
jgi:hypothetical protein